MNAVFSMGIAWAIASATAPARTEEPSIAVEVDVSALPDEDFTRWLEENLLERQKTVLHDGGIEVAEGADADATIRVTVSRYGELGVHYRFTVTLTEAGATTPKAEHTLPCELCKDSVLVTKVGDEVARMSGRFMYEREEAARVEARDAGAEAEGTEPSESKKARRVGGAGWAGIGLAAVGVGFAAGGAVELAKPATRELSVESYRYETFARSRQLGAALVGVGAGLLVTGAVLIVVDQTVLLERRRRRARPLSFVPSFSATTMGLSWSGRF